SRYGKEIVQIDAAEQKSQDTASQDTRPDLVHRGAYLIQDHESDNGKQHSRRGGDIRGIHAESPSEDNERAHSRRIRDRRRKRLQEYICQEMSLDDIPVRLHRQEKRRDPDRKHTDQRDLGRFQRIREHKHDREKAEQERENVLDEEQARRALDIIHYSSAFQDD